MPELSRRICRRRHGLIPQVLASVLHKRARLKTLKQQASSTRDRQCYERRQAALKWILVTCFGYLGYKNARFGRIEAHEAVTAYSRERLLQAKEVAEAQGVRLAPGEAVQFIITAAGDADPAARVMPLARVSPDRGYDCDKYLELRLRAAATVLGPLGYDHARLQAWLNG